MNWIEITTVSLQECLHSTASLIHKKHFKEFHTVLKAHNGHVFGSFLLVRSLEQCDGIQQQIEKVYFPNTLVLIKQLLKEKNQMLWCSLV